MASRSALQDRVGHSWRHAGHMAISFIVGHKRLAMSRASSIAKLVQGLAALKRLDGPHVWHDQHVGRTDPTLLGRVLIIQPVSVDALMLLRCRDVRVTGRCHILIFAWLVSGGPNAL